MTHYFIKTEDDDGTVMTCSTNNMDVLSNFLKTTGTYMSCDLDQKIDINFVNDCITNWAEENLPPLPSKEMLAKMKSEAGEGESHEQL